MLCRGLVRTESVVLCCVRREAGRWAGSRDSCLCCGGAADPSSGARHGATLLQAAVLDLNTGQQHLQEAGQDRAVRGGGVSSVSRQGREALSAPSQPSAAAVVSR